MLRYLPALTDGLLVTLEVTLLAIIVAALAALLVGSMASSENKAISIPARIYIEIFRGMSALVLLFWLYYALPHLGYELSATGCAVAGLGLHFGAYGGEIVRGAVKAVPKTSVEAGRALNLTPLQIFRLIKLPLAMRRILPPAGNLSIELLKNSALVSLITLADLTFKAKELRTATMQSAVIFGLVLLIYYLIARVIDLIFKGLEKRAAKHVRGSNV